MVTTANGGVAKAKKEFVMMDPMLTRFGSVVRGLWSDTSGVILPYVTIMLVVIVGTSVLALDGSRYMSLQTQLQKAADAFALAAAAELDRFPDAIDRANRAIDEQYHEQQDAGE